MVLEVTTLYRIVRKGLLEKVTFEERPEEVRKGARWLSGEKHST